MDKSWEDNPYEIEDKVNRVRVTQMVITMVFLLLECATAICGYLLKPIPLENDLLCYGIFTALVYIGAVNITVLLLAVSPTLMQHRRTDDLRNIYVSVNLATSITYLCLVGGSTNTLIKIVWVAASSGVVMLVSDYMTDHIFYLHTLYRILDKSWAVTEHALVEEKFCAAYNQMAADYNNVNEQVQEIADKLHKKSYEMPTICPLKLAPTVPQFPVENIHLFWCEHLSSFTGEASDYCKEVEKRCLAHCELLVLLYRGAERKGKLLNLIREAENNKDAEEAAKTLMSPCEEDKRIGKILDERNNEDGFFKKIIGKMKTRLGLAG